MTLSTVAKIRTWMQRRQSFVAAAESVTGGRIQSLLTSESGASDFFAGGTTAYRLRDKVELLSVDESEAAATNCVSESVARQMALGALELFACDWSVSTTGYATAEPAAAVPHPFAFCAVAYRVKQNPPAVVAIKLEAAESCTNRVATQRFFATAAVEFLLRAIETVESSGD